MKYMEYMAADVADVRQAVFFTGFNANSSCSATPRSQLSERGRVKAWMESGRCDAYRVQDVHEVIKHLPMVEYDIY